MTRLALEALEIRLDGRLLVRLDAEIEAGACLTVTGPSGAGKSTLLATIAGFRDPAFAVSGAVRLDGVDVTALPPEARRFGLLFQDPLLFPHLSVLGNLLFGAPRGPERRAAAEAALVESGLAGFGPRDPATLSGGQAARVALLRTLLARPNAVLLDEPFARLDAERRAEMRAFTRARIAAAGLPMVLVTHDPADAEAFGGRVVRL